MLASFRSNAQNTVTITGKVQDLNNNPVIGATVTVKGSSQSALTNEAGIFTLKNVRTDATLVVTYVGFETNEVRLPYIF